MYSRHYETRCGAFRHTKQFHENKPNTLLDLLADLVDMFENCAVCKGKAAHLLFYLLSDGAKEKYEACSVVE